MTATAAAELVAGCMREQAIIPDAVKAGGLAFYPQTAGGTALHHAAALGNPDVLDAVIDAARDERTIPPAFKAPTPLHVAVMDGHPTSAKSLIESYVKPQWLGEQT